MPSVEQETIVVGAQAGPLERKAAEMLADRVAERLGHEVRIVAESERIERKAVVLGTPSSSGLVRSALATGRLDLPSGLGSEGFALEVQPGATAFVAALDPHGLVYGVGRLLRESRFSRGRWDLPRTSVLSAPDKALRPIYFATHFGNWYCHASIEDLRCYVEDLALWGYNALVTWFDFHHYRDLDDGTSMWDRLTALDKLARDVGMHVGRIAIANESFEGQADPALRAAGRPEGTGYETDLCPSKPEARSLILADRRAFLERVRATTSLDWLILWPYDQGGCNCESCTPWPVTYLDLGKEIAALTAQMLPGAQVMVSAWWIGAHQPHEDDAFFECLVRRERWFRTIVAGTAEVRRWLRQGRFTPEGYDLVLFPEVSMFDALPWGSRGANPAPRRFAAEMSELGTHLAGAMPYSEGRYEDLNKVLWAQLQWDSGREVSATLEDYCRFYFGAEVAEEGAQLMLDVEEGITDLQAAGRRERMAVRMQGRMEEWGRMGWRWQVLRARTAIDALRRELDARDASEPRLSQARAELRSVYEHLQHDLYLHDRERSLHSWIYLPFEEWVETPFHGLRPDLGWLTNVP